MIKENAERKITTVVPMHQEIDRGTLLEIMRQCKLSREQFIELI